MAVGKNDVTKDERNRGLGSRISAGFGKIALNEDEEIPELRGQPARPADFKRPRGTR
jgi:hypothetical protein